MQLESMFSLYSKDFFAIIQQRSFMVQILEWLLFKNVDIISIMYHKEEYIVNKVINFIFTFV